MAQPQATTSTTRMTDRDRGASVLYEGAGAEQLATQPNEAKRKPNLDGMSKEDWSKLRQHLETNLAVMRSWRDTWWIQNWSDLAQFILPRRSIWLTQSAGGFPSPNTMTRGLEINESILDPTATFAARICAGGLMSGLASPSRPWFKIIPAMNGTQLDDAAKQWIDQVEDIVYTILARSNFYNSFAQECEDIVVFGTSVCIIYEDNKDVIRCYNPCAGEYYLATGATLRVDTLNRAFVYTVKQLVDFFGVDNCTPDVQRLWAEKGGALNTERLIAHSIEPNFPVGDGKVGKVKGAFTWREVYWVYGSGCEYPLSIRGFMDQPFTAARWSTQSNDAYGRSPGMDILPDVMQLQVETARKGEGIEKGLRPPLLASAEMKNQPSSGLPGHITYMSGDISPGKGMRSIYETNFDLDHVTADLALIQQRIKVGLFNDLFLAISSQPTEDVTATAINAKRQEAMALLGPVVENLLSESLQPKLRRIFGIAKRKGLLPPVPKSLQNVALDIQFVSILAVAMKAANLSGIEATVKLTGELMAIDPQVADNINTTELLSEYSEMVGNKAKILNSSAVVQQIRQQRAQQQQQAHNAAMAQNIAQTASTGAEAAQTLSNTTIGAGKSVLDSLLPGVQ